MDRKHLNETPQTFRCGIGYKSVAPTAWCEESKSRSPKKKLNTNAEQLQPRFAPKRFTCIEFVWCERAAHSNRYGDSYSVVGAFVQTSCEKCCRWILNEFASLQRIAHQVHCQGDEKKNVKPNTLHSIAFALEICTARSMITSRTRKNRPKMDKIFIMVLVPRPMRSTRVHV